MLIVTPCAPLTMLHGVGPVVASRLLGRAGRGGWFVSASAFANCAGVAPVKVASARGTTPGCPRR